MTAEELKASRKKLGLSQFELAVKLGFTPSHISLMETGRVPIRAAVALAMTSLLRYAI